MKLSAVRSMIFLPSRVVTILPLTLWLIGACVFAQDSATSTTGELSFANPDDVAAQPVASEVMSLLRGRDLPAALKRLEAAEDRPITFRELVYSDLPSAAGGVFRALSQESSDEQYARLASWTMPSEERKRVRMLTAAVPTEAPPKVFARAILERPRDSTFAVASVGPVSGLFCSGWMFVTAAEDLGRLARLRETVRGLVDDNVPGAEPLWMLSQLAGSRGDLDVVNDYLIRTTSAYLKLTTELEPGEIHALAVAAAAMNHAETRAAAELCLDALVTRSASGQGYALRPFLRIAQAIAIQVHRGESSPEVLFQNRLAHWVSTTMRTAKQTERGHPGGVWLSHEQHLLHLAGGGVDVLFLRYPIVGDFEFIVETQEGGAMGTDGGLVYGGLHFQATGRTNQLSVWDADLMHESVRPSLFARSGDDAVFNRVSIHASNSQAQFESNFHPIWTDGQAANSSPWIGLRSVGSKRPVFRNIRLIGNPVIPREVNLIAGDELRGWEASFFGETQPPFRDGAGVMATSFEGDPSNAWDWSADGGQLVGRKLSDEASSERPGLIRYQRPLIDGESITYEFKQDAANSIVHPVLGRIAFLIEENGVRVRWITTGESEWSSLAEGNAALEPLNRRGKRPLPFRPDDWNRVRLQLAEGKVLVHLNDSLIYQRELESGQDTKFGFHRPDKRSEVRVRNVVMTGPWPETVPESFIANPTETTD